MDEEDHGMLDRGFRAITNAVLRLAEAAESIAEQCERIADTLEDEAEERAAAELDAPPFVCLCGVDPCVCSDRPTGEA